VAGDEAPFVACTFWYAECLAHQGRVDRAREAFDRAMSASNDLGLFSEEFDPRTGELLGNFPQGLTHLSHLTAAIAIVDASHPEVAADHPLR
jgi:GH15 family glucan-1,4-alpha-glucosidase